MSLNEFVIPMALGLVLSMIQSQIVATAALNPLPTGKRNQHSLKSRRGNRERVRRKRKSDITSYEPYSFYHPDQYNNQFRLKCPAPYRTRRSSDIKMTLAAEHQTNLNIGTVYIRKPMLQPSSSVSSAGTKSNSTGEEASAPSPPLRSSISPPLLPNGSEKSTGLRKRNVNFSSANLESTATIRERREASVRLLPNRDVAPDVIGVAVERRLLLCDDDGFESLNGKSSSGEDTGVRRLTESGVEVAAASPPNIVR